MYLAILGNQLLSSIFADYISILSKLRRNTDIQGIWMDYQNKTLFFYIITKSFPLYRTFFIFMGNANFVSSVIFFLIVISFSILFSYNW